MGRKMKLLTLDDYIESRRRIFPKHYYVNGEMGEDAKPEDVLKVMEAVEGLAWKCVRNDDEVGPLDSIRNESRIRNF